MELICMLCPAIISLFVYRKNDKKKDVVDAATYYLLSVLIVNVITLFIVYFIFGRNQLLFTVQFTFKYLLMASIVSFATPKLIECGTKAFENIKKIILSGVDKNGKFHIKDMYNKNKKKIDNFIFIISSVLYFYLIDIVIRSLAIKVSNFGVLMTKGPFLMTLAYLSLFIFFIYFLPKIFSKTLALIIYLVNTILFLANYFLLLIKGEALNIYELNNAGEGSKFLNFLIDKMSLLFILLLVIIIVIIIINYKSISRIHSYKKIKFKWKYLLGIILLFIVLLFWGIKSLPKSEDTWQEISFPKYYYDNLANPKKSLAVLGLYEYTFRDIHVYIKNKMVHYGSKKEIEETIKKNHIIREDNNYTGIFKDKNVIMIMLESIDYVVLNEEVMPNMYRMMNEGWTFPKRFSALSTGGNTIATEYTSMTSLFYDTTYYEELNTNNYDYSLPNMFKKEGYKANSMHENHGVYYNRDKLHNSLGFDNSYFLYDILKKPKIYNDAQMVTNENLYKKLVFDDDKFMSLMITIAAHGPYDNTNGYCKKLGDNHTDIECFNYLAKRTDDLFGALLQKLERDKLLDDTVIVLYTDHQAYAYNYPEEYLNSLTKVDDNRNIKAVPLVIYNPKLKNKSFDDILVNDIDIAPTILNLWGINYNPDNYLGVDIFSKDHKNLILFSDYSWYDGMIYSSNSGVDNTTKEYKNNTNYTKDKVDLGKMIISNNYYKSLNKKK